MKHFPTLAICQHGGYLAAAQHGCKLTSTASLQQGSMASFQRTKERLKYITTTLFHYSLNSLFHTIQLFHHKQASLFDIKNSMALLTGVTNAWSSFDLTYFDFIFFDEMLGNVQEHRNQFDILHFQ